jgi:two-component SAPR family response regulator
MLFLFLYQYKEYRKEEVIEAIWPGCSQEKGNSSFQSTVYRIRRALYKDAVIESNGRYTLNRKGRWWLDAREFSRLVQASKTDGLLDETRFALLEEAVELYKGQFLFDFDSNWVDTVQRTLHESYIEVLAQLSDYYMKAGRYNDVIRACTLVLEKEPYHDEAIQQLMAAYDHLGNSAAAIRSYRQYAANLHQELEDVPSRKVRSLYRAILSRH